MVNTIDARDLYEAIQWSYIVVWQAERLTATQDTAYRDSQARRRSRTTYEAEDRYPFHRLAADRHFFLNAANQLQRALRKIGYAERMPTEMADLVRIVRNCNEHWDDETGPARKKYDTAGGTNPRAHRWGAGGTILGELIEVEPIVELARRIHRDLVDLERRS